jgi:hypothetical protein
VQEEVVVVTQQCPYTILCACPRKGGKTTSRHFATPPYSPDLAPCDYFFFLRLKEELCGIDFSQLRLMLHKGSHTGPSCKYLSAVFPAVIPTLADLHSSQQRLLRKDVDMCKRM